jgi:hypothetical protein
VAGPRLTARAERVGSLGERRPLLSFLLLVAVAALGYLIGHGMGNHGPSNTGTRTVLVNGVLLDYPSAWKRTAGGPQLAGLALAEETTLTPPGRDAGAGLTVGSLAAGDPGPLPEGFLAQLRSNPHTDVVSLSEVQAYRYTRINVAGFNRSLTAFAIPNAAPGSTVLACYASANDPSFLRACAQVVDAVTRVGQPLGYDLSPVAAYARSLGDVLAAVQKGRAAVARAASAHGASAHLGGLAARLRGQFSQAASSLQGLEAPAAAQTAQSALVVAARGAGDAYGALSEAVRAKRAPAYVAARARVAQAQARVNNALRRFALLGYA